MFSRTTQDLPLENQTYNKFHSMDKDNSFSTPSFRVYYGLAPASVPFKWESQPGTSKYTTPTTTLPPLTPPPSYYSNSNHNISKKSSKFIFLKNILPRLNPTKPNSPSSPSISFSTSSVWSSSSSASLFGSVSSRRHSRFSSARMSFSSAGGVEEEQDEGHRTTTKKEVSLQTRPSVGCKSVMAVRKALMFMVCHRNSQVIAA